MIGKRSELRADRKPTVADFDFSGNFGGGCSHRKAASPAGMGSSRSPTANLLQENTSGNSLRSPLAIRILELEIAE